MGIREADLGAMENISLGTLSREAGWKNLLECVLWEGELWDKRHMQNGVGWWTPVSHTGLLTGNWKSVSEERGEFWSFHFMPPSLLVI